jgi:hypothetical protein
MKKNLFIAIMFLFFCAPMSLAQIARGDFLLHFDGNLNSSLGESPTQYSRIRFEQGIIGQGARLSPLSVLQYSSQNKINPTQGTIEMWAKPNWNSNDGLSHPLFTMGEDLLIYKSTSNQLKCYLRNSEAQLMSLFYNFPQTWRAGEWHHIAITWNLPGTFKLYVDGIEANHLGTSAQALYQPFPENISIGRWRDIYTADAVIDELRVSRRARSAHEIGESFTAPLQISNLRWESDSVEVFRDWNLIKYLFADTQIGNVKIPVAATVTESRRPEVAIVTDDGRIQALSPGRTTISAAINGLVARLIVVVRTPAREPEIDVLPQYLQEPARECLYKIPVVMIKYLPTRDGVNVDSEVSNYTGTLDGLNQRLMQDAIRTKFMLEEGSRFHGYKDPLARSSIGYQVVYSITIYEDTPPGFATPTADLYFPDYNLILNRIGAESFITGQDVKQFWLWTYHHGNIVPVESNMSSPITGDISNSYGYPDDMPVYDRTYTLYNYNFTRGANENVHNHGHQLEALLGYANWLQDGNTDLFWKKFVGRIANNQYTTGRCGWTHMPPNTTTGSDYGNLTLVPSDIEHWTPEGLGRRQLVNAATWRDQGYIWPEGTQPGALEQPHWYIYWMQNMPGRDNRIPYLNTTMTNWWAFTGDWDTSIQSQLGLYGNAFSQQSRSARLHQDSGRYLKPSFEDAERIFPVNSCAAGKQGKEPEINIRFDPVCLQDDVQSSLQIAVERSFTNGEYRFVDRQKNISLSGEGDVTFNGCKITLTDYGKDPKRPSRRVIIEYNTCTFEATAYIWIAETGKSYVLHDSDSRNSSNCIF